MGQLEATFNRGCEPCNPIILQVILSKQVNGWPEHYYYDFTNNQLGEIDAYIQQMELEDEAKRAEARELMWDIMCAIPTEAGSIVP
jgi:hypothetical protein